MKKNYICFLIVIAFFLLSAKIEALPIFIVQNVNVYTSTGLITSKTTISAGTPLTIEGIFKNAGNQDALRVHTLLLGRFSQNGDTSPSCLQIAYKVIDVMRAGEITSYSVSFTPDLDGYYQIEGAINQEAKINSVFCGWNLNVDIIPEDEPPYNNSALYNYGDHFFNRNLITVLPSGISEELELDVITPISKIYFPGETLYFHGNSPNGYYPMTYKWKTALGRELGTTDYAFSISLPSDIFPPGTHTIIVEATDAAKRTATRSVNITVANTPFQASITLPVDGSNIPALEAITLLGNVTGTPEGNVTYSWEANGSGGWRSLGNTLQLDNVQLFPTDIQVKLSVRDGIGRTLSAISNVNVTFVLPPKGNSDELNGGEAPVNASGAEFKVLSVVISSNSPFMTASGEKVIIQGYPVTATVTVENSSSINATSVPVSIFVVPYLQQSITTEGEIPMYVDLPAHSTKTLTVVIDYALPANIYTFYALVNRQIKLGNISINYPTIPEVNPFNNTKVQSFVAYSCTGLSLNIPAEVSLTGNDFHRAETITVGNLTLAASSSLTLVSQAGTLSNGFHAQPNSKFSFTASSCASIGSANARSVTEELSQISDLKVTQHEDKEFSVFPNPFSQELTIKSSYGKQLKKIELSTPQGQSIYSTFNFDNTGTNEWRINTTTLHPGLYILVCQFDDYSVLTTKVIKE